MKKFFVWMTLFVAMFMLTGCEESTGKGTRNDPYLYKEQGAHCKSLAAYAKTRGGTTLQCYTSLDRDQTTPHWNPVEVDNDGS